MAPRTARLAAGRELRDAKAYLRDINVTIARHASSCAPCCFAHGNTRRLCETGWELAKRQAKASSAVRRLTEPSPSALVQGELW